MITTNMNTHTHNPHWERFEVTWFKRPKVVTHKITSHYRQTSNMSRTNYQNLNKCVSFSSCSYLCPIHWNQVLSREWRCSWSSADRQCICVITNFETKITIKSGKSFEMILHTKQKYVSFSYVKTYLLPRGVYCILNSKIHYNGHAL